MPQAKSETRTNPPKIDSLILHILKNDILQIVHVSGIGHRKGHGLAAAGIQPQGFAKLGVHLKVIQY